MPVTNAVLDTIMTFTISGAAAEAIALDDLLAEWAGNHRDLRVRHDANEASVASARRGRGTSVRVTCTPRVARLLIAELAERADTARFDWDQPTAWTKACRAAADRVREVLPRA